jgi:hypothetical protein
MSLSEQLANISEAHPELMVLDEAAFMLDHYESRIEVLELTIKFLLAHAYLDPISAAFVKRILEK